MYILGLVGFTGRSHDASACLVKNGKIVSAAEEERFVRRKHAYDFFPHNSAKFCLEDEGIGLDDVEYVAVGWNLPLQYSSRNVPWKFTNQDMSDMFFPRKYFPRTKTPKIEFTDHHLSHASSAYRCSGYNRSAILVIDGQGEHSSSSIWVGNGNDIKLVKKFPIKDSLGYFYEALTQYCGFRSDDSGKLMGLAPYGLPVFDLGQFFSFEHSDFSANIPDVILGRGGSLDEQYEVTENWFSNFAQICPKNEPVFSYDQNAGRFRETVVLNHEYENFAASGQKAFEEAVIYLVEMSVKLTGSRDLCMAGGVALNCSANGRILRSGLVDSVFIQPAANDAGCSIGAALEISSQMGVAGSPRLEDAYLGPGYSDESIRRVLKSLGLRYQYTEDIESKTADLIAQDKIVGWFQERMEIGPRALGHRSIIANPKSQKTKDVVNAKVKFRESFRPFAPSIVGDYASEYIIGCKDSPFMLLSYMIDDGKLDYLGAVTHVDGTTRPQTVEKDNEKYYRLLKEVERRIGVPAVLNTSFNRKGEPMVCTPRDALECFFGSGMDYLVMGNLVVQK